MDVLQGKYSFLVPLNWEFNLSEEAVTHNFCH